MQAGQLGALKSQVNKIEKYEYELWHLYEECNDYEGGSTLLELEKILSNVSVTESEVSDMAKLIEDGAKSYER